VQVLRAAELTQEERQVLCLGKAGQLGIAVQADVDQPLEGRRAKGRLTARRRGARPPASTAGREP
jgi:hypothetical protein